MKHIAHEGGYRCYLTTNGRDRRYLGCIHETPRQALDHTSGTYAPALRSAPERQGPSGVSDGLPPHLAGTP